ncbi:uncharacterized protein V6R79_003410 [Siganus canaliculatus]
MSESAEAVAANLESSRYITIEITNITNQFCLIDPSLYLESGNCHNPPQPSIRPQCTEVCNFVKSKVKATGAVGVLAYDVYKQHAGITKRIVIMFSVPYDQNFYKNWLAVGMFDKDTEVDKSLYKSMYNDPESGFVRKASDGSIVTYTSDELVIMATMSPLGRSIMKVEVWDKDYITPSKR